MNSDPTAQSPPNSPPLPAMEVIPRHRFRILTLVREPLADVFAQEWEWYRDPQEVVIGTVFLDTTDEDWGFLVMGRDENGQFRWIDGKCSFASREAARAPLWTAMREAAGSGQVVFPQPGEGQRKRNRLLKPMYPEERLNPAFRTVSQNPGYSPAAELITQAAYAFTEPDGNFVEQFQTAGFDARLWELYLFIFLREVGCRLDRRHRAPDFVADHFGLEFALEAVTVNPSQGGTDPVPPTDPEQLRHFVENYSAIRFGNALLAKLRKHYWELPQVTGKPFVLAIADFHQPLSMMWSPPGLLVYLYGYRHEVTRDEQGNLVTPVRLEQHVWENRSLPSGFFFQPDTEHISAVLFSNSATIAKFNRIGKLARFGDLAVRMVRAGLALDPDGNADRPIPFRQVVDDQYVETWAEGVSVFHNPRARHPLPEEHFPEVLHHYFREGQIVTRNPGGVFHPISSFTHIGGPKQESVAAGS